MREANPYEHLNRADLYRLSAELHRLADNLPEVSDQEDRRFHDVTAGMIRSMIRARKLRNQCLGSDLFADPAWDMMLDLYAAQLEGRQVAVSSLCIAAAVPPTTALRWIGHLEKRGVIERSTDPNDGRRIYIGLTQDAALKLREFLKSAHRISGLLL